ncbi:MAG: hypothetical protein P8J37_15810 [Fuerstiella sp.]|nr:hypothetical protein [Fuerstiella sp.]
MIHGYHVIFGAYGFWLPNDPRGSWSEFVGAWELLRFGPATKSPERQEQSPGQDAVRQQAKQSLKFPAVEFDGQQARAIGRGFHTARRKSNLTIWACSILPSHVHLVIARHTFKVEYVTGLLKGDATKQLNHERLHPLADCRDRNGETPTPWNIKSCRIYLDTEHGIEEAIRYVEHNPPKEGKPPQFWSCVTPFAGLGNGWVTYH